MSTTTPSADETAVLHVGGLDHATEKAVVEHALGNRPGVVAEANPVALTATVTPPARSTARAPRVARLFTTTATADPASQVFGDFHRFLLTPTTAATT